MKDDTVSRAAVMESLTKEYNRRRTGDGLKLAWIEKAVNDVPAVDAIDRQKLVETIKHYAQYPDGISRLLEAYAERKDGEQDG